MPRTRKQTLYAEETTTLNVYNLDMVVYNNFRALLFGLKLHPLTSNPEYIYFFFFY